MNNIQLCFIYIYDVWMLQLYPFAYILLVYIIFYIFRESPKKARKNPKSTQPQDRTSSEQGKSLYSRRNCQYCTVSRVYSHRGTVSIVHSEQQTVTYKNVHVDNWAHFPPKLHTFFCILWSFSLFDLTLRDDRGFHSLRCSTGWFTGQSK